MSARFHILREDGALTLARHLPVRFDFEVRTALGAGDPLRLAHQIRQDLWRALQRVRGYSPVVELTPGGTGWQVRAGGRTARALSARDLLRAQAVLDRPANRARWLRHAERGL